MKLQYHAQFRKVSTCKFVLFINMFEENIEVLALFKIFLKSSCLSTFVSKGYVIKKILSKIYSKKRHLLKLQNMYYLHEVLAKFLITQSVIEDWVVNPKFFKVEITSTIMVPNLCEIAEHLLLK